MRGLAILLGMCWSGEVGPPVSRFEGVRVSPETVDFGTIAAGQVACASLTLQNDGDRAVDVRLSTPDLWLVLGFGTMTFRLDDGMTREVVLFATPLGDASRERGTLALHAAADDELVTQMDIPVTANVASNLRPVDTPPRLLVGNGVVSAGLISCCGLSELEIPVANRSDSEVVITAISTGCRLDPLVSPPLTLGPQQESRVPFVWRADGVHGRQREWAILHTQEGGRSCSTTVEVQAFQECPGLSVTTSLSNGAKGPGQSLGFITLSGPLAGDLVVLGLQEDSVTWTHEVTEDHGVPSSRITLRRRREDGLAGLVKDRVLVSLRSMGENLEIPISFLAREVLPEREIWLGFVGPGQARRRSIHLPEHWSIPAVRSKDARVTARSESGRVEIEVTGDGSGRVATGELILTGDREEVVVTWYAFFTL